MTKVTIEAHPNEVIDVNPEVITAMKRRLKQTPKQKAKALDDEIARLFHANFSNIEIPIMALIKIYDAARTASSRGENMLDAMAVVVESVKVSK